MDPNDIEYNPVEQAYIILVEILHNTENPTKEDYEISIEEAIGYLGEALK